MKYIIQSTTSTQQLEWKPPTKAKNEKNRAQRTKTQGKQGGKKTKYLDRS